MDVPLLPTTSLFLVLVNCGTVLLFWRDKRHARIGARRVPEADLLALALVGGSPGALVARHVFRHKTRKEPFSTYLLLICALQLGAVLGVTTAYA